LTLDAAGQICVACLDIGLMPAVRVPANSPDYVSRILDAGALGVIAPHVHSSAVAREVVKAAKLPPQGERSTPGRSRTCSTAHWLKKPRGPSTTPPW
jgi:2-keto-3-deoxy-L-rhamnonate aldolase RhmA